ncbi:MAG: Anthranilate synthase component 1 [Pelotomaculum sp. PtaU1.Bin035]|nr:MAG: Anthranilate synthase component 1 [Pelotomaculum sp. PtaU1.Bin035]
MNLSIPSRQEYLLLSKKYDLIPVCREINADMDTPISIFKKISPRGPAYLLESVEGGESLARYSFIGFDPFLNFTSKGEESRISGGGGSKVVSGSPLENLAKLISGFHVYNGEELPRFFGGAVGYLGYGAVRFFERINISRKNIPDLPDSNFIFAGTVLIFDHVKHSLKIVINSFPGENPESSYDNVEYRFQKVIESINRTVALEYGNPGHGAFAPVETNMTRENFIKQVERAKEYIKAGDILQVVLSQRFRTPFQGEPFNVYRRLRALNPSPYLYYLDFGTAQVVGSSPEMLVRVVGDTAETCPIAGTRPRGKNLEADRRMAEELLEDAKERAEHLMLVDLGRNDLGKVCEPGSIKVSRFMEIERFSHVMHLVSNVKGRMSSGRDSSDALRACFPAGTVTGAPKVRAMEIIDELEPDGRGVYAGAIGYFGFTGNLDTAIAIRTVIIREGNAYVQAGAGIVADSDPEREYEETINKARALLNTIGEAG